MEEGEGGKRLSALRSIIRGVSGWVSAVVGVFVVGFVGDGEPDSMASTQGPEMPFGRARIQTSMARSAERRRTSSWVREV